MLRSLLIVPLLASLLWSSSAETQERQGLSATADVARPVGTKSQTLQTKSPVAQAAFHVTAYLPDYRLPTLEPARLAGVTDLIYFSISPLPTGDLDLQRCTPAALRKLHELTQGRSLRVLIAVGGWERGDGFAPMIADPKARAHFIHALTQFCRDNKFAGADFDWEGPQNPAQETGYGTLLHEIKQSFALERLRLTVAQASWEKLPQAGLEAVDEIHVMAYDHEGEHATLAQAQDDIAVFVKKGVPKKKLFLGLPFYGRAVQDRTKEITYAEIVQKYHPLAEVDRVADFYFNNTRTITIKTRMALQESLGGVSIWELGQDTLGENSLLQAVALAAKQQSK